MVSQFIWIFFFFFQAEDGIRDVAVTGVQTCALPISCRAEKGAVIHTPSNRRLTYGKLVAKAATVPLPHDVPLKDPKDWKIVGTRVKRLDTPPKVDGSAQFGIDVKEIGRAHV